MQKIILGLCFGVMAVLLSCNKKQNVGASEVGPAQVVGTWELREAQSGMIPNKEYPSGNGNRFQFAEATYQQYTNNSLVKSGTYAVVQDTTVEQEVGLVLPAGQFRNRIVFDNNQASPKTFFELSSKKLILLSGYFPTDGGSRQAYEKIESGR